MHNSLAHHPILPPTSPLRFLPVPLVLGWCAIFALSLCAVAQNPTHVNTLKVGGGYEDPPGVGTTLTNTGDGYFRGDLIVDGDITGGSVNVDLEAAFASPYPIGSTAPNTGAFTTLSATSLSLTTPLADSYVANTLTITAGDVAATVISGSLTDAQVADALTVTGYMQDSDIDTFAELQAWVTDKTLLNAEDDMPWADADVADILTIGAGSTIDPSLLPATDLASPGPIGGTTPSTAVFDPTVTATGDEGSITLNGDLQAIIYDRFAPDTANYFRWQTGESLLFENTAGADMLLLNDAGVTVYGNYVSRGAAASFGVSDTTAAQLRVYGGATTGGGSLVLYNGADNDTTTDYVAIQPGIDELWAGPSTNGNCLRVSSTYVESEGDLTAGDDVFVADDISYTGAGEFDISNPVDTNLDIASAGSTRFWTDSNADGDHDFVWYTDAATAVMVLDTSTSSLIISGNMNIGSGKTYQVNSVQISSANLSDSAYIAHINAAETLSANWVNTANPWASNEITTTALAQNVTPSTNNTRDVGSGANKWNDVYTYGVVLGAGNTISETDGTPDKLYYGALCISHFE